MSRIEDELRYHERSTGGLTCSVVASFWFWHGARESWWPVEAPSIPSSSRPEALPLGEARSLPAREERRPLRRLRAARRRRETQRRPRPPAPVEAPPRVARFPQAAREARPREAAAQVGREREVRSAPGKEEAWRERAARRTAGQPLRAAPLVPPARRVLAEARATEA